MFFVFPQFLSNAPDMISDPFKSYQVPSNPSNRYPKNGSGKGFCDKRGWDLKRFEMHAFQLAPFQRALAVYGGGAQVQRRPQRRTWSYAK